MHTLTAAPVTVMHLALDPAPRLHRVVEVTDALRSSALWHLDCTGRDSLLAGKTRDGQPARLPGHPHAHWLPVTDGRRLHGICLWVPGGLDPDEETAVRAVAEPGNRGTWLRVTHVPAAAVPPMPAFGQARAWETVTPFVQTLRPNRKGAANRARTAGPGAAEGMIRAELASRGLPGPVRVLHEPWEPWWPQRRPSRPAPPLPQHRVRVEFPGPVRGPVAIGRLAHFGLGLMLPAGELR